MAFGNTYVSGANPQPFGNSIGSQVPFWYVPSQGNLLLDIRGVSGRTVFPGDLDAVVASGDSISRVVALSNFAGSGTPDTLGLVTRIDFTVVPEPATWGLLLTGCAIVLFSQWRQDLRNALCAGRRARIPAHAIEKSIGITCCPCVKAFSTTHSSAPACRVSHPCVDRL
jgi:hypothetical protein